MSKKTRKKSPKPASRKAARAVSATSAKQPPSKTRRATASKSGKRAAKPAAAAAPRTSHKAPSKQLRKINPPAPRKAVEIAVAAEGAKAPAFSLPRDGGGTVALSDFSGKKLVLFFYPRADTPGCTREAIDFTRLAGDFAESHTEVLGVSADPPSAQEAFRDKHQLKIPLVSDEQHRMLEAYGVWGEKSMYGRTFLGIIRTTVLIGAGGPDYQDLAQCEGRRPCRRGAVRGAGAMI